MPSLCLNVAPGNPEQAAVRRPSPNSVSETLEPTLEGPEPPSRRRGPVYDQVVLVYKDSFERP